ncbi:hypothetical protein ITP53_55015 [Nonomuraea sp. K274]|uniref:CPBP family intramembrane metalloprotease n=1 Tax=Nonomuraea cypriaca TaxID=1187855 RepID=A0A931AMA0_9ACTN|nr:hypothetical protein [Nonomuraea cypriaca]MBF8194623.1 hypothetical protein [Nonomuraea cypriaca]
MAGSVVSTAAAGVLLCELRRHRGLLTPVMLHLSTNSLGYLFARIAAELKPVPVASAKAGSEHPSGMRLTGGR